MRARKLVILMGNKYNRFKVEVGNSENSADNSSGTSMSLTGAIALMLESAFKEGMRLGQAKERDEEYTPSIGPFFSRDVVQTKAGHVGEDQDFYSDREFVDLEERFDLTDGKRGDGE